MSKLILIAGFLGFYNCAHSKKEAVAFEPPIPVTEPKVVEEDTNCVPKELDYFHRRCKAIYGHLNYCVTYFHKRDNPDGSYHIDILCGVQDEDSE